MDENWLREQLRNQSIHDLTDIFYAGLDTTENLYVSKKQREGEDDGKHGIE